MQKNNLKNFIGGWVVGSFKPNIIFNEEIEVSVKFYNKNDKEKKHFHKLAKEITIVANGSIKMNDEIFYKNEICILEKGEECSFESLEDGTITVVIKNPSVLGDKYFCE